MYAGTPDALTLNDSAIRSGVSSSTPLVPATLPGLPVIGSGADE